MIDRFENIADLHEDVFQFLLGYQEKYKSNVLFSLNDNFLQIEEGLWFEGNKNSVRISFAVNQKLPKEIKNSIQFIIYLDNRVDIQFYLTPNTSNYNDLIERYKRISRGFTVIDSLVFKTDSITDKIERNVFKLKFEKSRHYKTPLSFLLKILIPFFNENSQNIPNEEFQNRLIKIQSLREKLRFNKVFLKNLEVKGYLGVKHTYINLLEDCKWIFLTGENGAGKTLILQAIALGFSTNTEKRIDIEMENYIDLTYVKSNHYKEFEYKNSTQYFADFNFNSVSNLVGYGPFRLDVLNEGSENRDSPRSAPTYGLFGNYDVLFKNIETELKFSHYENKTKFEHLTEMLKQVIPTLHKIEFDAKNRKVYYYEKNGQNETEVYEKISFSELATGVKSIIAMVGDIYLRFSGLMQKGVKTDEYLSPEDLYGIVIIDELDLHLHPKWQKALPSLLSKVFPNIQFIASTHSAIPILGAPENSVLLRVNRNKEDGITVERLEHLEKQLKDLTPNLILTSEIFGLQDIFPVTHDKSQRIRTEDTMEELQENDEMMEALKSYMDTDKEDELLKLFSK